MTQLVCIGSILLTACAGTASAPLSFRPELFMKQDERAGKTVCILLVDNVSAAISELKSNDVMIQVSGTMSAACSNLQVSMEQPDISKNIYVNVGASTTSAEGGSTRPFTVELSSRSLRYGQYTVWVNGTAETIFSIQ